MTDVERAERRRSPRYPVRVPVTVVACDGAITGVHGHTIDISRGGLRVLTDSDVRHGVEQTILFDTAGGPIVARADVLRTEHRGSQWVHGMLITQMDVPDEVRLLQLCAAGA